VPSIIDGKPHCDAVRRKAHVKAPGIAAVVATIINVQVVVWLVRTLVLAESDVTVDA
jgi:hypothetical protein